MGIIRTSSSVSNSSAGAGTGASSAEIQQAIDAVEIAQASVEEANANLAAAIESGNAVDAEQDALIQANNDLAKANAALSAQNQASLLEKIDNVTLQGAITEIQVAQAAVDLAQNELAASKHLDKAALDSAQDTLISANAELSMANQNALAALSAASHDGAIQDERLDALENMPAPSEGITSAQLQSALDDVTDAQALVDEAQNALALAEEQDDETINAAQDALIVANKNLSEANATLAETNQAAIAQLPTIATITQAIEEQAAAQLSVDEAQNTLSQTDKNDAQALNEAQDDLISSNAQLAAANATLAAANALLAHDGAAQDLQIANALLRLDNLENAPVPNVGISQEELNEAIQNVTDSQLLVDQAQDALAVAEESDDDTANEARDILISANQTLSAANATLAQANQLAIAALPDNEAIQSALDAQALAQSQVDNAQDALIEAEGLDSDAINDAQDDLIAANAQLAGANAALAAANGLALSQEAIDRQAADSNLQSQIDALSNANASSGVTAEQLQAAITGVEEAQQSVDDAQDALAAAEELDDVAKNEAQDNLIVANTQLTTANSNLIIANQEAIAALTPVATSSGFRVEVKGFDNFIDRQIVFQSPADPTEGTYTTDFHLSLDPAVVGQIGGFIDIEVDTPTIIYVVANRFRGSSLSSRGIDAYQLEAFYDGTTFTVERIAGDAVQLGANIRLLSNQNFDWDTTSYQDVIDNAFNAGGLAVVTFFDNSSLFFGDVVESISGPATSAPAVVIPPLKSSVVSEEITSESSLIDTSFDNTFNGLTVGGKYMITVTYLWFYDAANTDFIGRVIIDGEVVIERKTPTIDVSGAMDKRTPEVLRHLVTVDSETLTVSFAFGPEAQGTLALIDNCIITAQQVE